MATARELLEQADALMRRNRLEEGDGEGSDIPMLLEVVESFGTRPDRAPGAETGDAPKLPDGAPEPAMATAAPPAPSPGGNDAARRDFDDVPLLTDAVADLEPISVLGAPEDAGEPSQWPDIAVPEAYADRWMASGPADAPVPARDHAGGQLPAAEHDGDGDLASPAPPAAEPVADRDEGAALAAPAAFPVDEHDALPATEAAADSRAAGAIRGADDAARWASLAEEVRMQVLQRIDIFTDTGLQEQLTARLQPIVDRASADLVATINQQVGQLLRAYVAEAIEREIDKWRQDGA